MRRILPLLLILSFVGTGAFAQTLPSGTSLDDFETSIQDFADGVAASLPLHLALGLNWSDSYIGQLPHFGVGLSVGGSTVPFSSVQTITDTLGVTDAITGSEASEFIEQYGFPIPAIAAEARVGGIIFPFDVGVKLGTVPEQMELEQYLPPNMTVDYLLAGFDVRMSVIKERGLIPEVAIGGGYNIVDTRIGIGGLWDGDIELAGIEVPTYDPDTMTSGTETITVAMTNPAAEFEWTAQSLDLKAQISKKLFIITPYLGAGASLGFGSAGGGLGSQITVTDSEGNELTAAEIEELNDLAQEYASYTGADAPTIPQFDPEQGFAISSPMTTSWAFRAYGGVSLNLLFIKVDLTAMTDFQSGYAGSIGVRFQL